MITATVTKISRRTNPENPAFARIFNGESFSGTLNLPSSDLMKYWDTIKDLSGEEADKIDVPNELYLEADNFELKIGYPFLLGPGFRFRSRRIRDYIILGKENITGKDKMILPSSFPIQDIPSDFDEDFWK